jgi:hypothetical protein
MLSLRADGTPDQVDPEMIGDPNAAREATAEQFRQQAVSAVDQAERGVVAPITGDPVEQDPEIARLKGKHEETEESATGAALRTVDALFTSDPALTTGDESTPADTPKAPKATGGVVKGKEGR